jgi:hypothetical protein
MHNIEKFGGRRIEEKYTAFMKVQFPSEVMMNCWLAAMRSEYNSDQFSPVINQAALTVTY